MHLLEYPALALVEIGSIARAHLVGDAMVKRAAVRVVKAGPVTPGKYLILIEGDEASVEESWLAGRETAGEQLLDCLYLPGVHTDIAAAVRGERREWQGNSLVVVETATVAKTLLAADAACKAAAVRLLDLRLAMGIGGKGVFRLEGELPDAEAAADAAREKAGSKLQGLELIAQPDPLFAGGLWLEI